MEQRFPLYGFSWSLMSLFFFNMLSKSKFCQNLTNFTGTVPESLWIFRVVSFWILQVWIFHTKVVEEIETHFMSSNFFPQKSSSLRGNTKNCGRARHTTDENMIQCIRFACWISKATDTHSEYSTHGFFTARMFTQMHLYVIYHLFCFPQ